MKQRLDVLKSRCQDAYSNTTKSTHLHLIRFRQLGNEVISRLFLCKLNHHKVDKEKVKHADDLKKCMDRIRALCKSIPKKYKQPYKCDSHLGKAVCDLHSIKYFLNQVCGNNAVKCIIKIVRRLHGPSIVIDHVSSLALLQAKLNKLEIFVQNKKCYVSPIPVLKVHKNSMCSISYHND
jgi:hypothetical protein